MRKATRLDIKHWMDQLAILVDHWRCHSRGKVPL